MKDQIESSLWILGNSQISGQIIAGAGGNVAEDDFGRICNALKGLVYRAVPPRTMSVKSGSAACSAVICAASCRTSPAFPEK